MGTSPTNAPCLWSLEIEPGIKLSTFTIFSPKLQEKEANPKYSGATNLIFNFPATKKKEWNKSKIYKWKDYTIKKSMILLTSSSAPLKSGMPTIKNPIKYWVIPTKCLFFRILKLWPPIYSVGPSKLFREEEWWFSLWELCPAWNNSTLSLWMCIRDTEQMRSIRSSLVLTKDFSFLSSTTKISLRWTTNLTFWTFLNSLLMISNLLMKRQSSTPKLKMNFLLWKKDWKVNKSLAN